MDEGGSISDDEILPEARVFEYRAENLLQSKIQALKELMNKAPEEFEELKNEDTEQIPKKGRKPRGKRPQKGKSKDEVEDDTVSKKSKKPATSDEINVKPSSRRNRRAGTPTDGSDEDDDEDNTDYSLPRKSRRRNRAYDDLDDIVPKKSAKGRKRNARIDKTVVSDDLKDLVSSVTLPAASKRKIQELKLKSYRLQKRADIENERILSACDAAEEIKQSTEDAESDQSIIVKIRFMCDISKLTIKLGEKFASIYSQVADLHNLQASEILLCVNDQTIKPDDTPLSLNLKYFDLIDCLPYKPSEDKLKDASGKFLLKMQSNDTRKKINVYGSKFEKFDEFMRKYSEIRNIPMDKLSFEFDGEKIDGIETPDDLDIESGSCIDVNVIKTSPVKGADSDSDIEVTADIIPQSCRMQICELDSD